MSCSHSLWFFFQKKYTQYEFQFYRHPKIDMDSPFIHIWIWKIFTVLLKYPSFVRKNFLSKKLETLTNTRSYDQKFFSKKIHDEILKNSKEIWQNKDFTNFLCLHSFAIFQNFVLRLYSLPNSGKAKNLHSKYFWKSIQDLPISKRS